MEIGLEDWTTNCSEVWVQDVPNTKWAQMPIRSIFLYPIFDMEGVGFE